MSERLSRIRAENPDHLRGADWMKPLLRLYFFLVRW